MFCILLSTDLILMDLNVVWNIIIFLLNSLPVLQLENEERDKIQKMKDEECARATAELDFWRETQRKTAEEKENRQKLQGAGKRDNKPVYQKTERANVTPAITPLQQHYIW